MLCHCSPGPGTEHSAADVMLAIIEPWMSDPAAPTLGRQGCRRRGQDPLRSADTSSCRRPGTKITNMLRELKLSSRNSAMAASRGRLSLHQMRVPRFRNLGLRFQG